MSNNNLQKLIEETNKYRQEDILEIVLGTVYPGFTEYIKAIHDSDNQNRGGAQLGGTEPLIEETKQLIKESEEAFNNENLEQPLKLDLLSNGNKSRLENWINGGKVILSDELNIAQSNINILYDMLADLNDAIDEEEERYESLLNLLEHINS